MTRREMDIEAMLIWAYRDQRVDLLFGRCVGLFNVERRAAGLPVQSISGDGCAVIERDALLGCRIDGGGPSALCIHPDAEAVHEEVRALKSRIERAAVIESAKTGERPDWMPGARAYMEPVLVAAGKRAGEPVRIYDKDRNWIGCRVTVGLAEEVIDARRAFYEAWRGALVKLAGRLAGRLLKHQVVGPRAPARPWGYFRARGLTTKVS